MSREELLQGIQPDTKLTKDFLRRIYGYELTYPGFADRALTALEQAGHVHARQFYEVWLARYEVGQRAAVKEAGVWYLKECEKQWERLQKGGDGRRKSETHSADTAQSSCLQQQKEKLSELKQRLHSLN